MQNERSVCSKIWILGAINVLLFILVWICFVPKEKYQQTWGQIGIGYEEETLSSLQGVHFEHTRVFPLVEALPRGSYTVSIELENAPENSFLQVRGTDALTSIYSSTVSCALSPYGTEYEISFENTKEGNSVSLVYYGMQGVQIKTVELYSTTVMMWQVIGCYLLLAILIHGVVFVYPRIDKKKWAIILGVAVAASIPLFGGAIYYGHDTLFHITRVEGLKAGLLAGQFPVRISAVQYHEYGYVSSALYPELFLYFPALLRILNIPISYTYGVFWFVMNLVTAYIAWYSFEQLSGERMGGVLGAVLYTLLPYRLISIYLRGAFGEALVLTWLPLLFLGVYELLYRDEKKWPLAVIGFSGVLQSHILTTANVALICVGVGLCSLKRVWKEKQRLVRVFAAIGSIGLANLWFLVPFVVLYQLPLYVKQMGSNFLEHVLYPSQLFAVWLKGTGNSMALQEGIANEMPFSMGAGLMVGTVCVLVVTIRKRFVCKNQKNLCMICLGAAAFFYWTTTLWFPWRGIQQVVPFMTAFIANLPWRRLGVAGLFLTVAVVLAVVQILEKKRRWAIAAIMAGVMISSGSFLISFVSINEPYIVRNQGYDGGTEDELYLYFGTDIASLKQRGNKIQVSSDQVEVRKYSKHFTNILLDFVNASDGDEWLEVPLNYYPGYVAYDEVGNSYPVVLGTNNIARVSLPQNSSGTLNVRYENCTMYRCASLITFGFVGSVVGYQMICHMRKCRFYGGKHG